MAKKKDRTRYYKKITSSERKEIKRAAKANSGIIGDRSKISLALRKGAFKIGKGLGIVDKRRHYVEKGGAGNYLWKGKDKDDIVKKDLLKGGAVNRHFKSLKREDKDKDIVNEVKEDRISVEGVSEEEVKRKFNKKLKERGKKAVEDIGRGALTSTWEQNESNKADVNEQKRRVRYISGTRKVESEINKDANDSFRGVKGKGNGSNKLSKRALYRSFKKRSIKEMRKKKGLKDKFRKFDKFSRIESIR